MDDSTFEKLFQKQQSYAFIEKNVEIFQSLLFLIVNNKPILLRCKLILFFQILSEKKEHPTKWIFGA